MKREIIPSDIVSGAIVAAIIIISFLSLMSFADFLRVHWQQPPRRGEGNDEQQRRNDIANGFGADDNINNDDGGIDEAIVEFVDLHSRPSSQERQDIDGQLQDPDVEDARLGSSDHNNEHEDVDRYILETQAARGHELAMIREARRQDALAAPNQEQNGVIDQHRGERGMEEDGNGGIEGQMPPLEYGDNEDGDESSDSDGPPPAFNVQDDDLFHDEDDDILDEIDEDEIDVQDDDNINNLDDEPMLAPLRNGERPFDPMDPVLQDDQVVG
jgi:E3 ubiquitin-protein ligase MARCH6